MGLPEEMAKEVGYNQRFANTERSLQGYFGSSETLSSFDTYQFKDIPKFVATRFDPAAKLKRRQEIFPKDCQKPSRWEPALPDDHKTPW